MNDIDMLTQSKEYIKELLVFYERFPYTFIYGAGCWGKCILRVLSNLGKHVDGFIVSDGQSKPERVENTPVYCLSEVPYQPERCGIIPAIESQIMQAQILQNIQNGIFNVSGVYTDALDRLPYYRIALATFYLDCTQRYLKLDDFIIPNFLEGFAKAMSMELVDFILPAFSFLQNETFEGPYELNAVILERDDIVIDCGANLGLFAALAAYRGCNVYAFEPVPYTVTLLEQTQKLYPKQIHIVPSALSDTCQNVEFLLDENFIEGSHIKAIWDRPFMPGQKTVAVNATSLDEFVRENRIPRVDFIKADIEGAERLMLRGAQNVMREFAPKLAICTYHLPDDKEVLEQLILEANPGYVIEHKWMKLYAHVPGRKK